MHVENVIEKHIFRTLPSNNNIGSSTLGIEPITKNAKENSLIMQSFCCRLCNTFLVVNPHHHRYLSLRNVTIKKNVFIN